MRRFFLFAFLVGLSIAAGGCEYSAEPTFYLLKAEVQLAETSHIAEGISLAVDMPEYLNRPQLVRRTSDYTLRYDEQRRWAEPLEITLSETLAENLRNAAVRPVTITDIDEAEVVVTVRRFDDDGRFAYAEFKCTITDAKSAPFWVKLKQPIDPLNLTSIAAAQSNALAELAKKLAEKLK
ncbi:MAG: hypothetical protein HN909_07355 [Phycisphaerales bacterium]|jgi:uncharacterized protein|nr:hypothetical protein [Phycisphaerales bacterium]MBT7171569.1 hypothetical protein [Phycisphaerales bacterium]